MDMSGLGNLIVVLFMSYYSFYIIKLVRKKDRDAIKTENFELDKIRKIPIKNLEDQKRFLDMKYPKSGKFKFHWRVIPSIIFYVVAFGVFMRIFYYLLEILKVTAPLWVAIMFVMIMPILINMILAKFNLQQKSDLLSIFKKY